MSDWLMWIINRPTYIGVSCIGDVKCLMNDSWLSGVETQIVDRQEGSL